MKKIILWIFTILFIVWLCLSFVVPYYAISDLLIFWFPTFFVKYMIIVFPISIIWLGLILAKGKWKEIINYARVLIVFSAIFLVASFCFFKWTCTVNVYGMYDNYVENAEVMEKYFRNILVDENSTSFERETIYREKMRDIYNLEFKKMWTFSIFVFFSTFLLLFVIPKKLNYN